MKKNSMIISDNPPPLQRLKPFRWRRTLKAGEASFSKVSRLGGGPMSGRDGAALGESASLGTPRVKVKKQGVDWLGWTDSGVTWLDWLGSVLEPVCP